MSAAITQRDHRIDFFRGLALTMIFIDHIPGNGLAHLSKQACYPARLQAGPRRRFPQASIEVMRAASLPAYQDYVAEIGEIAEARKVPLLRRYAIMRHLAETPDFEFGTLLAADKFHHSDEGYACLGTLMADAIEASVKGSRSASPGR